MEQGIKEFLGLLRAFVQETPLTDTEAAEIDLLLPNVLSFAQLHQVQGIWAYKIREYARMNPDKLDADVVQTADRIFAVAVKKSMGKERNYQELSKHLSDAEIDHLPMKGIEVKAYYPVPELRTFGDIDIVIRSKDRKRTDALMRKLNYSVRTAFEPVYTYEREQDLYEVHTGIMAVNLTNRADYIGYFQNLWQYAAKKDTHVWEFTPEFHFVYLLSHIAKHIYGSGAGIRMYLDLAFYVRRMGVSMDWTWIQAELNKLKLHQFFCLTMDALRRWFDVELPIAVPETEETLFEMFTQFTMESDVFGYSGRSRGEQEVRKVRDKDGRRQALKKAWFPSADDIKSRYTYLNQYPYLLPVAWIDRLLRNVKRIGFKLEESKEILMTEDAVIQRKTEFYHKIGL